MPKSNVRPRPVPVAPPSLPVIEARQESAVDYGVLLELATIGSVLAAHSLSGWIRTALRGASA